MAAFVAALLAAPRAEGGLADVNLGLTVWTIVLFAVFVVVLTRFGWGPLLRLVEEREKGIKDAWDGAQRSRAEAQALFEKHKEMVREAGRERDEILKRALKAAEQLKADIAAQARSESERMIQRARDQIEHETAQALVELRTQVADVAIEAAAKLVTSSLTPEAQRKLVNDFVASLPRVS